MTDLLIKLFWLHLDYYPPSSFSFESMRWLIVNNGEVDILMISQVFVFFFFFSGRFLKVLPLVTVPFVVVNQELI